MNELIELTKIDFVYIICIVITILAAARKIIPVFEWFIKKLGLETKWMRNKKAEHNLLIETSKNLSSLQEKHDESVKQSIRHDELIKKDILNLTDMVNDIANTLSQMQEKENETKLKELKGSLIRYYNKFKNIGEWSKLEKDAFWDLFDDYEKRGGDGYMHSIVEPVMRELEEID